jgi:glycosyltransferase involved in cell wall biosynthesis
MRISLIWQGFDGRYGQWRDGLWAAMQILSKTNEVRFFDFPLKGLDEFDPDVVLYWEAPVTNRGKDADNWFEVCALPYPKALLFAGGPLKAIDVKDFDLVFTESEINDEDCEREGIPYKRAFGVNTEIFKPLNEDIKYDGFLQATFAEWKRHELFAKALQSKGAVAGRTQEHDTNGYDACVKQHVTIFPELPAPEIAKLINQSLCVVNTAAYWGGGQRCTLEAMACGVPVLVMADSPKNCEYVRESGGGIIVEPDVASIREGILNIDTDMGRKGFAYVQSKWTERHYAKELLDGIHSIL